VNTLYKGDDDDDDDDNYLLTAILLTPGSSGCLHIHSIQLNVVLKHLDSFCIITVYSICLKTVLLDD
jgi:hypothetical protein